MSPVPDPSLNHKETGDANWETNSSIGIVTGSSSEDDEAQADNNQAPYQPLPQDDMEEENIDYSSLNGLMAALNSNGPTEIETDPAEQSEVVKPSDDTTASNSIENKESTESKVKEATIAHKNEYANEVNKLWKNDSLDTQRQSSIQIDETKVQEIKSVMLQITLPPSAVPAWAKHLSDEDWKTKVLEKVTPSSEKAIYKDFENR